MGSNFFQMRINGWNYSSGLPEAGANESTASSGRKSPISGGAIAGIVIGIVGVLLISLVVFFIIQRKQKRRRTHFPSGFHEKAVDNPSSKPELLGSTATDGVVAYHKPELAVTTKSLPSQHSSSREINNIPCEVGTGSSQTASVPYDGGAGAPTESDERREEGHTGASDIPHENLNGLKAQERELAHRMELTEDLQRMRAEHAALMDRIRIAEMKERELSGRP